MGIQSMEYLRLSPGELERYTKDAAREVRLQRLHEVRRQASLAAQQQRRNTEQKKWLEEKAVKTVEVRAELAAKRVQLEGLLKLKEACHQECNAMESAQLRQVADQARRCAAEALEAERQKQEALRCLEACRQHKASQAEQLQASLQRRKQRETLRAMERQRAAEAAALGRAGQEAQKLVEQRWKREALQAEGEEKVLKTDISGLQQLSKTCVKVLHEATLEAEEQPRQKAPEPSPAQRQAARSRGLAAQQQLRAQRHEKEAEQQKQDMEKKERSAKAAAVAQRGKAWSIELLPWRMGNNCKAAQHELSQILASNDGSVPREKLRKEPSSHSVPPRRCRSTGKMPRKKKSIATWQGPSTVYAVWPTVEEVKVSGSTMEQPNPEKLEISKEPRNPTEPRATSIPSSEEPKVLLPAPRPARPILEESELSEPLKSTRVGEEDLAMRLDDICRELDIVGLCAWEADDEP